MAAAWLRRQGGGVGSWSPGDARQSTPASVLGFLATEASLQPSCALRSCLGPRWASAGLGAGGCKRGARVSSRRCWAPWRCWRRGCARCSGTAGGAPQAAARRAGPPILDSGGARLRPLGSRAVVCVEHAGVCCWSAAWNHGGSGLRATLLRLRRHGARRGAVVGAATGGPCGFGFCTVVLAAGGLREVRLTAAVAGGD